MRTNWRRRGFSLIELLIVISIILIIAAIAVPKMNKQLMLAREQAAIRQIGTIHQAETQYYSQFGNYAQSLAERSARPLAARREPNASDIISQESRRWKKQRLSFHGNRLAHRLRA